MQCELSGKQQVFLGIWRPPELWWGRCDRGGFVPYGWGRGVTAPLSSLPHLFSSSRLFSSVPWRGLPACLNPERLSEGIRSYKGGQVFNA